MNPGYKCLIEDISENGALIKIGGKGLPKIHLRLQFQLDGKLIVMFGIIRTVEFDSEANQSKLHFECLHIEPVMKNIILSYVYNILSENEKEVFEGQDFGKIANAFAEMFSIDNERCSQIVNGLWILGIVKTEENKDGSYDYKKLINEKTMACMGWFLDDCIIDYETIKKYFGKYKLIRKFCDERLEQQKK